MVNKPASRALTLIELLVVIVIITTLVGGVIPLLSPNNDTRKIAAAARGLQGYITVAQSQAARTGRPHGIAFRESSPGSGVALEVFGLEVPPPFAGFSTDSRVRLVTPELTNLPPGVPDQVQFVLAASHTGLPVPNDYALDLVPPNFFRVGDRLEVDGATYRIVDTDLDGDGNPDSPVDFGDLYTLENGNKAFFSIVPEATSAPIQNYQVSGGGFVLSALKPYKVHRQPTNSSATPYQLPSSIAIDMQASVAEGTEGATQFYPRFPVGTSLWTDRSAVSTNPPTDTVGIMFSPTGAVRRLLLNGIEMENASRIVLLLGRVENGGIAPTLSTYPWVFNNVNSKDELNEKQEQINWLNLDSRLLSIVPSNGRVVVSEPAFVDPSLGNNGTDVAEQIEAAHSFAHEMNAAK